MKLLKQFNEGIARKQLNEDAAGGAVGAGAVAACAMPLFSTLIARSTPKIRTIKWAKSKKAVPKKKTLGLKEAFGQSQDGGGMSMNMDGSPTSQTTNSFDASSVISKLKSLEDKSKAEQGNTATFGLEDEHGGIVRVTVSAEQSEEFEKALQAFLAREEQNAEKVPEIAEVLFKLKDQFDILNVVWPEVHEDEEEDVSLAGGDAQGQQGSADQGDMDLSGDPNQADPSADPSATPSPDASGDADAKGLLTQVIDMMKADADARKAEAKAKEAEAKAREADAIIKQTMSKVKQEEQFMDMEQYDKSKKDEEREVKRLAKLARWKHEMGENGEDEDADLEDSDLDAMLQSATKKPTPQQSAPQQPGQPGEEEERTSRRPSATIAQPVKPAKVLRGRIHPHDIASFILSRVK